jgi:hypothetical protein
LLLTTNRTDTASIKGVQLERRTRTIRRRCIDAVSLKTMLKMKELVLGSRAENDSFRDCGEPLKIKLRQLKRYLRYT